MGRIKKLKCYLLMHLLEPRLKDRDHCYAYTERTFANVTKGIEQSMFGPLEQSLFENTL